MNRESLSARLSVLIIACVLAVVPLVLVGCGPDLPGVPEPAEEDSENGSESGESTPPDGGEEQGDPAARSDIDPDDFVPPAEWIAIGSYSGTAGDAKRLTILEPNVEYRFVCTIDEAPGSGTMLFAAWVEDSGARVTQPIEVVDGTVGGFEFAPGSEIPEVGFRLVTATTGFVSWDVTVYRKK